MHLIYNKQWLQIYDRLYIYILSIILSNYHAASFTQQSIIIHFGNWNFFHAMTMQLLQYQKYQSTKLLFQGESLIGHHFISNKRRQKNEKERKGKEREKKTKRWSTEAWEKARRVRNVMCAKRTKTKCVQKRFSISSTNDRLLCWEALGHGSWTVTEPRA